MKKFVLLSLAFICFCAPVQARDLVIALSPHQSPQQAKTQIMTLLQFLTTLEAGDRAVILNGASIQTIGTFNIPTDKSYSQPKARLLANKSVVAAMLEFAAQATGDGEAVNVPQILDHVAQRFSPSTPMDVLVLASPLFDDPKEPAFSMKAGLLPSDGHILARRADTPFGTKGNEQSLANIRVHWGFSGEDVFLSDHHRHLVKRFWTLYLRAQGGALSSFTADKSTVFERVRSAATLPSDSEVLDSSSKLEMMRLRTQQQTSSIYERPISREALRPQMIAAAQNLQIGISWDCALCDVDLHARASAGAAIIFYGNNETSDGIHIKDFLSSPQSIHGYETIEFKKNVDLRQVNIAVNFYHGTAQQGIRGEIRIATDGKTYAAPFIIAATSGNQGRDLDAVFQSGRSSAHSLYVSPMAMIVTQKPEQ